MKQLIIVAVAVAFAPLAGAQLYKYVDKDGKTVYSDQPPANVESKQLHIAPGGGPAAPARTATAADKDQQKKRDEQSEKDKKAEKAAADAKYNQERCATATSNYRTYSDGGRIAKHNEKGEREFLSDEEIEAGREKFKREMEEACKK